MTVLYARDGRAWAFDFAVGATVNVAALLRARHPGWAAVAGELRRKPRLARR